MPLSLTQSEPGSGTTAVLAGFESVGKSALFRGLTRFATGDEANFRGSTTQCRKFDLPETGIELIDTPGIRVREDCETTRLALDELHDCDTIVLVVRATHARSELAEILTELRQELRRHAVALVVTFADKAPPGTHRFLAQCRERFRVPQCLVDARSVDLMKRQELISLIRGARPPQTLGVASLPAGLPAVDPAPTIYEHRFWGPAVALATMAVGFILPVYLSYVFASWAQPIVDSAILTPLADRVSSLLSSSGLAAAMLVGDYGLLTLGWYSFLWAFPVVLLIGCSVSISEETGIKDHVCAALDPMMRRVGLAGRDLIPVLTGFGCNAVAVLQSRSCSRCSRKACVSMIAFGSACSYQIGASLSLFNSGGRPWLFLPYLVLLVGVGALHTRVFHSTLRQDGAQVISERAFIQAPSWRSIGWRVRSILKQFLVQAMPIFLVICVVGAALDHYGLLAASASLVAPFLTLLGLPIELAPGVIFSIIRKDGMLILNAREGADLAALSAGQLLIVVYLASTLTACLVTLWMVRRELGLGHAVSLLSRQVLTSVASTLLLAVGIALLVRA